MTEIPSGQTGRRARFKAIPKSKVTEWSGLDRIENVVHGMTCIWREQEKDDIGIDGEIELCVARSDGEGLVGTGKIVKVQSKAGSSYVVRDTDASFSSPVAEKDLLYWGGMNVPVVYIVYHPDDDALYWKDVKAYLAERPDALTPPHRIDFDKAANRFDENARPALHEICRTAPERISTEVGETLYTNLLEIERMPERIWLAPVLPQKRPHFHDRLTGDIPPYVFRDGVVATLSDPRDPGGALAHVVDGSAADDLALADWLAQDPDADNDLRRLMNSLVHHHLRSVGLSYQKHPRRYFFNRHLAPDSPLRRSWTSSRTGRKNSRLVAKQYEYGKLKFYRHAALDFRVETFGSEAAIALHPQIHFTEDGVKPSEGERAKGYMIKARAVEYNDVYLNNLLFWSFLISAGEPCFDLAVGAQTVATVSGVPVTTKAPFSVQASLPRPRKAKDGR